MRRNVQKLARDKMCKSWYVMKCAEGSRNKMCGRQMTRFDAGKMDLHETLRQKYATCER
jgi:hypothetical protein